ncbi:MAG: carotenoid 1,2-hydratase [Aquincola tertiaricarbonis]
MGSVFSPYYAAARRRGAAPPAEHCAINLALYGDGGHRWAMTERGSRHLHQRHDHLAIGPSALHWQGDALVIDVDEITAPWPQRLRGRIMLHPQARTGLDIPLAAEGGHRWTPLAPRAQVEVRLPQPGLCWRGTGYLDANRGDEPLEQRFADWTWARAALAGGRSALTYDVQPLCGPPLSLALQIAADGSAQAFEPPSMGLLPRARWGVARPVRGPDARLLATLEDGPFYTRSLVHTTLLGQPVTAVHESLSLRRFGRRWVQALLPFRMPRRG